MKFIFDIIKGAFVGVANIIPGVSGGTMAVTMGIYDKLINAINKLTKEFKKSFLVLLPIAIGMVLGVGVFSYIIPYSLTHFAFQTCMCFTGLIIGGMPQIFNSTKTALQKEQRSVKPTHIIAFIIMLAVAVIMAITNGSSSGDSTISTSVPTLLFMVVLGIIAAATMIIPGVSGSLVLMILGYYAGIVGTVRDFISALKNMNGSMLGHCTLVLIPFAIGCILGVLLISKLISWLFKKFESVTYFAIMGLIAASPFAIFYKMEPHKFTPASTIVGIVLFVVAAIFTYMFGKKSASIENEK